MLVNYLMEIQHACMREQGSVGFSSTWHTQTYIISSPFGPNVNETTLTKDLDGIDDLFFVYKIGV